MKVTVVGRRGQLALCLAERASAHGIDLVCLGRPDVDLTDEASLMPALRTSGANVVINAAAMTAVDLAESDVPACLAVNKQGAGFVAAAAASLGVPVIHISTDYVFDGAAGRAYTEEDMPNPLSVYGVSKLAGERAVAEMNPRHLIARTSWVYSTFGNNFVRSILAAANRGDEVKAVADQWGSPTSGHDLADAMLHAAYRLGIADGPFGLYHVAGTGSTNRSGQAREVLDASRHCGGPDASVREIGTASAGQRAPRPRNSSLSSEKFARDFGFRLPDWQSGTRAVVGQLVKQSDLEPGPGG
jgi:dTDP-4-dehydrorhamnose reductase